MLIYFGKKNLNWAAKPPVLSLPFDSTRNKLVAIVYHCSSLFFAYLQAQIMNKFLVSKLAPVVTTSQLTLFHLCFLQTNGGGIIGKNEPEAFSPG